MIVPQTESTFFTVFPDSTLFTVFPGRLERTLGLLEFRRTHGHVLVGKDFTFPATHPVPELRGFPLGEHVAGLLDGSILPCSAEQGSLAQMGLVVGRQTVLRPDSS